MSKTKKIIFWVFVGLICAAAVCGIVYECLPENVETTEEVVEEVIDTVAADTVVTVVDTVAVAE